MRRLRFPLLLLAVLALAAGACADDGELGGPGLGGTLAARVGAFEYTAADLEDEVERWAGNPAFLEQVLQITDPGREGRRSAGLVTFVLSHRVISEQARDLAEQTGYVPTDEEISALVGQIDQQFSDPERGPLFGGYPEEFRRSLGEDFAYQQNLGSIDPETVSVPEVAINPRYGTFEDQDRGLGQVVAPTGPVPLPFAFGS